MTDDLRTTVEMRIDMLLCQHCWHTKGPDPDRPERPAARCHCDPAFGKESRRAGEIRQTALANVAERRQNIGRRHAA